MKTIFKKSVAIMLAALILLSAGIAGVTASAFEPAGKLSFETKFFRYDDELGEWVETERAQKGEELKARVYVDTDYFTNSGELLFFYDKDFFTDNYEKNEINVASVNPYYSEACGMEGQLVIYGDGHRAVERMVESGAISADFASEHTAVAMLYSFAIRSENMKLSGEEWLFEFDLTVKEDTLADSGDFFAVATTVQSPDNEHGFVNVPVGKEGEYLEDTEILFGVYVDVEIRKNPVSLKESSVPEKEKYKLTLNANGGTFADGTEIMTASLAEGEEAYLPDDLTKTGYAFAGWTDENGEAVDSFVMPAQDTELVANWAPAGNTAYTVNTYLMKFDGVTYDVKSDACYGTTDESVQVVPEEIEGFTFDESKSETETVILPDGTAEINLYYTRNQYDFTTYVDGEFFAQYSYLYGETVTETDIPRKVGYNFVEWVIKGTENKVVFPIEMPAENLELVANWAPAGNTAYTVNTYLMKFDGVTYDVKSDACYGTTDESVQVVPEEIEGFTFDESKSETETVILPDGTAEINLYYARNQYDFTTYVDGEFFAQYSYLYGETVTETDIPRKVGYNFVEWVIKGTENKVVFPIEMPAENLELEAVYETAEFTATFNTDGGNEIEPVTVRYGEDFVLPSATKTGYSFVFWRDSNGAMYGAGQTVTMPANNVEFKAVWLVQSYSVTYTIGKDTVKFDVVPGNEIPLPDMSVYENAELLYWLDANGKRVEKFPAAMPESNLTFTAVLRYTFVDSKYGITASFESGCFDYEGDELDFIVEKFNGVKESGGVYYKDDNYKQIEFYNIKFCHGATTVQPKKGSVVHIGIPVPAAYKDGTEFLVIHRYGGDGYEQITQTKNGDKLKFDVYNFGDFEVCVESGTTVKTSPSKTSYAYKEALDLSGLTLEMLDANGNKAIISDTSKMNVKGYDSKKIGKQTVTVEYDGTTTYFDVSVAYTWWQTLIRILLLGFLWY